MDRITFYSFIILAMITALPFLSHMLRKSPGLLKWSNYLILFIYLAANLYLTLLSRDIASCSGIRLTPFYSYVKAMDDPGMREEVILNIYLYIPLGYLMHYAFPKMKWWHIFLCGIVLSCITEATQWIGSLGFCELDDVISNSLGTLIGIGMYKGYKRLARDSIDESQQS